jgi:hypothetical protein
LPSWLLSGAVIGAAPLLADYLLGWRVNHGLSALLLLPLLVAAVARDAVALGLGALAASFGTHAVLAITLVVHDPAGMALMFPEGEAYWGQSRDWLLTGTSREYSPGWWLPAHGQLLAVSTCSTYTSLGWVPLWQGFHEVDLMNHYVGRLVVHSRSPGVALAVGWHPWSVCRGVGYLFITFEVVSISLQRLTGRALSTAARRRNRWAVGLTLLVLDGLLKFFWLEPARQILAANLT